MSDEHLKSNASLNVYWKRRLFDSLVRNSDNDSETRAYWNERVTQGVHAASGTDTMAKKHWDDFDEAISQATNKNFVPYPHSINPMLKPDIRIRCGKPASACQRELDDPTGEGFAYGENICGQRAIYQLGDDDSGLILCRKCALKVQRALNALRGVKPPDTYVEMTKESVIEILDSMKVRT